MGLEIENDVMSEDQRTPVKVSLYQDRGERTECKNYKCINLSSGFGKNLWDGIFGQSTHRD